MAFDASKTMCEPIMRLVLMLNILSRLNTNINDQQIWVLQTVCTYVSTLGFQSCPVFTPVESSMSECQMEPNILSFEVPYSEGVTAHRRGRDCLDCQRIWKGDKDLLVSVCLQLCFSTLLYNQTHKASVGHRTFPSPSVIIGLLLLIFY